MNRKNTALFLAFLICFAGTAFAVEAVNVAAEDSFEPAAMAVENVSPKKVKLSWEEKLPDADPAVEEIEGKLKTFKGRVSGAGYNGLAVELPKPGKKGPSEIWFNYAKGLKLSGITKLAEIQEGDTVSVVFKEIPDGRRFLREITLVKKKPAEESSSEEESEEEGEE